MKVVFEQYMLGVPATKNMVVAYGIEMELRDIHERENERERGHVRAKTATGGDAGNSANGS